MPEMDATIALLGLENPITDPSGADSEPPAEVAGRAETAVDKFSTPPQCRLWRETSLLETFWGWFKIVGPMVPLCINRGFSGDLSRGRHGMLSARGRARDRRVSVSKEATYCSGPEKGHHSQGFKMTFWAFLGVTW